MGDGVEVVCGFEVGGGVDHYQGGNGEVDRLLRRDKESARFLKKLEPRVFS
jgi:hypothetical protein